MKLDSLSKRKRQAVVTAAFISLVIMAAGWAINLVLARGITRHIQEELSAISRLKAGNIAGWHRERMADAQVLSLSPILARNARRWFEDPKNSEAGLHLRTRLEGMLVYNNYSSIMLCRPGGQLALAVGEKRFEKLGLFTRSLVDSVFRSKKIVFSDFYVCDIDSEIHLDVLAPLLDNGRAAAVVILRIDPCRFLFPLIQSWPVPRKSAETLILRRQGDTALFLNDLRFRADAAMKLKIPLSDTLVPAAMAALGRSGMVVGRDYRGTAVLADVRAIPGTPWFMVAKVDQAEALAQVRQVTFMILGTMALLIFAVVMLVVAVYQGERKDLFQRLYLAELERKALASHYEWILKNANDIIILADEQVRIVDVNDRALEAYGYSREEIIGRPVDILRSESTRQQLTQQLEKIKAAGSLRYETEHQRKDGQAFPVEVSARFMDIEGRKYFHAIIRDITERKAAQDKLETAYEELQASYEEIEAANQELRAADEELQEQNRKLAASEEELKQKNEELTAAEEELRQTVESLEAGQKALKKEMDFSQAVVQNTPAYFVAITSEGKTLRMNPAFLNALGYNKEEIAGAAYLQTFVPEEDHRLLSEIFDRIVHQGEHTVNVNRVRTKDGRILWVEWYGCPLMDDTGRVEYFVGLGIDITERKAAQEELARAEERFRLAEKAGRIGSWEWDMIEDRLYWTDEMFRIFDQDPKTFTPTNDAVFAAIVPEDLAKTQAAVEASVKQLVPFDTEYRIRIKDGTVRWVHAQGRVLTDQQGQPVRALGIVQDVTERNNTEQELQKRYQELKRWQAVMLNREDRILELKQEMNQLLQELGRPEKYMK